MSEAELEPDVAVKSSKKQEFRAFFFLAVVLFPVLAVAFVGAYGFVVWMSQLFFFGPPHGH